MIFILGIGRGFFGGGFWLFPNRFFATVFQEHRLAALKKLFQEPGIGFGLIGFWFWTHCLTRLLARRTPVVRIDFIGNSKITFHFRLWLARWKDQRKIQDLTLLRRRVKSRWHQRRCVIVPDAKENLIHPFLQIWIRDGIFRHFYQTQKTDLSLIGALPWWAEDLPSASLSLYDLAKWGLGGFTPIKRVPCSWVCWRKKEYWGVRFWIKPDANLCLMSWKAWRNIFGWGPPKGFPKDLTFVCWGFKEKIGNRAKCGLTLERRAWTKLEWDYGGIEMMVNPINKNPLKNFEVKRKPPWRNERIRALRFRVRVSVSGTTDDFLFKTGPFLRSPHRKEPLTWAFSSPGGRWMDSKARVGDWRGDWWGGCRKIFKKHGLKGGLVRFATLAFLVKFWDEGWGGRSGETGALF